MSNTAASLACGRLFRVGAPVFCFGTSHPGIEGKTAVVVVASYRNVSKLPRLDRRPPLAAATTARTAEQAIHQTEAVDTYHFSLSAASFRY